MNQIKDLQSMGIPENFEAIVVISKIQFLTTRNGTYYANIDLMDKTGIVNTKIWDQDPDRFGYHEGQVVEFTGVTEDYQGIVQLRTINMVPSDEAFEDYMLSAPLSQKELKKAFKYYMDAIENESKRYAAIVRRLMSLDDTTTKGNNFFTQPAALRVHHAYHGGLAYHTLRMLQQAEKILEVYPTLNKGLLFTATLLHDLGKLAELSGYFATKYTPQGSMLGHISILDGWIAQMALDEGMDPDNEEDIVLLRHCCLAHHGTNEWGSPVMPQVPEAFILHQLDMTDSRMVQYEEEIAKIEPGTQTQRIFGLGNQQVYHAHHSEIQI